ncbi:hypothetical protein F2Q69_00019395 [Brassica cretica]|uniref:Uncharacterized protein n=1 Tax=Brassica cretica TaxID=69181 RepID=A0A8S9QJH8_BRACR|nr:hypothetical protein F2Q69_00019395 [Brassica cretica]
MLEARWQPPHCRVSGQEIIPGQLWSSFERPADLAASPRAEMPRVDQFTARRAHPAATPCSSAI